MIMDKFGKAFKMSIELHPCGCGRRMPGEPRVEVVGGRGGPSFSGVLFTLILSKLEMHNLNKFFKCCLQKGAVGPPISILLRREDEELGPGPARAGYRVSGSGLAWEEVFP